MENMQALRIIEALADGVNPYTGQSLQDDSVYENPRTIRALHAAARALERAQSRALTRQRRSENAGGPWSQREDEQLIKEFRGNMSPRKMASIHRRTLGAIHSRLQKKGLISD